MVDFLWDQFVDTIVPWIRHGYKFSLKETASLSPGRWLSFWGQKVTPPKINMVPQNGGLEDEFPFQ